MKTPGIKKYRGFTLVETLVYLALLSMALSGFVALGISIANMRNKADAMEETNTDLRLAADTLFREIRLAKSVEIPAKGQSSNILKLIMSDGMPVFFSTSTEGRLTMTEGTEGGIRVSGPETVFTNLIFTNLGEEGTKDSLKIEMTTAYRNNSGNIIYGYSQNLETAMGLKEKI